MTVNTCPQKISQPDYAYWVKTARLHQMRRAHRLNCLTIHYSMASGKCSASAFTPLWIQLSELCSRHLDGFENECSLFILQQPLCDGEERLVPKMVCVCREAGRTVKYASWSQLPRQFPGTSVLCSRMHVIVAQIHILYCGLHHLLSPNEEIRLICDRKPAAPLGPSTSLIHKSSFSKKSARSLGQLYLSHI